MPEPTPIRFAAFLSYAHADVKVACWLHGALEGFRVDKDLVGRPTALGPVPKRIAPIFRDREDFSGGHTLTDATITALDASAALIVVCSPVAPTRPAVNEEVRLFRWRHPGRPVIPVIVAVDEKGSDPAGLTPVMQAFPPALRFEIAPDGSVGERPVTILGVDIREAADGRQLGLAKVVAGLTGLAPDDIWRRAERQRRRAARFRNGVIGVLALLAVAASGSALYAWHQLKTNEAFLDATLDQFTRLVRRSVSLLDGSLVPLNVTLGILEEAEGILQVMAKYGRDTPKMKQREIEMLVAFSDSFRSLGRLADAERRMTRARALADALSKADPDSTAALWERMRALSRAGDIDLDKGDLTAALTRYREGLAIAQRLAKADPGNTGWQRDLSVSQEKVGDVLVAQGQLEGALKAFRDSLVIRERLATADPGNAGWQRDLSVSYERVGDVLVAQGQLPDALKAFRDGLAIRERLAKADPGNARWQRDVYSALWYVADVEIKQGDLSNALQKLVRARSIMEHLAKADPGNAGWQRDLSVSYSKVGDVLVAQGQLPDALKAFRDGLAISERLSKADPGNAGWQRDYSKSHAFLAYAYRRAGDSSAAMTHLRAGREIIAGLVAKHPDWAEWKRDLAWFDAQIAALERP